MGLERGKVGQGTVVHGVQERGWPAAEEGVGCGAQAPGASGGAGQPGRGPERPRVCRMPRAPGCIGWRGCVPPVRGRCCLALQMSGDSATGLGALEPLLPIWEGAVQGVQGQEEIAEGTLEMPVGRATFHPGAGTHREAESPG